MNILEKDKAMRTTLKPATRGPARHSARSDSASVTRRCRPMPHLLVLPLAVLALATLAGSAGAIIIEEVLEPPSIPGSSYQGTFLVTPSQPVWAFGVGNSAIEDTSISGIASIDGLDANDHWVSALISRTAWTDIGFDFDSIRPIGATPPSSFSIDTMAVAWQWGSVDYVAFYWLSEAGLSPDAPLAVLQTGTTYDAFRFFTSAPNSPFAAFTAPDGGTILTGETTVSAVPDLSPTIALLGIGLGGLAALRRRIARA